jgi:hypothetical protein
MSSFMKTLVFLFLISATTALAQTSPYAELYMSGDTVRIKDKLRLTSGGVEMRIFTAAGKEINARIRQAEVEFVQNATVVRTEKIKDTNKININSFRNLARPGDKMIIRIRQVEDIDRKTAVYLSKSDFSVTFE